MKHFFSNRMSKTYMVIFKVINLICGFFLASQCVVSCIMLVHTPVLQRNKPIIRSNVTSHIECVRKTCQLLFVKITVFYFNYWVKVLSTHDIFKSKDQQDLLPETYFFSDLKSI